MSKSDDYNQKEFQKGAETVWVIYNHMPNGHVVVQHFTDEARRQRVGGEGDTKTVIIRAEDQVKGFILSDFVALYQNGKLEKNKVLVYKGEGKIRGNPRAHAVVHAWAREQGVTEYLTERPKTPMPGSNPQLEDRVAGLESGQKALADSMNALAKSQQAIADALLKIGTVAATSDAPTKKG